MEGGEEYSEKKGSFCMQVNGFSGLLLQGKRRRENCDQEEEDEEGGVLELSLGLSMNGKFGVDPQKRRVNNDNKKVMLMRSSSISNFNINGSSINASSSNGVDARGAAVGHYAPLMRTCSLPAETEEEWRKRKEMQSMRRMEAKRKRMEKMKGARVVREKIEKGVSHHVCQEANGDHSNGSSVTHGDRFPSSQGSLGSQGSGSSGISEFESLPPLQGASRNNSDESPTSTQSQLSDQLEQKPVVTSGKQGQRAAKFVGDIVKEATPTKEVLKKVMLDMPCVSTRGLGPDGRKIEGFLYGYKKGEEVKIVCVCHGSFLSPAEFVKHAGGGDVEYPLKHIVVNPAPFL